MAKAQEAKEPQALVQNKQGNALTADMPDFLKETSSQRGTEMIRASDMVMPRMALCQSNTPQRKAQNILYIKDLQEGQFFNTLTKEIYGTSVHIIPLFFYYSRIMFKPFDEGGGIICQAPDGIHCALANGGPCMHQAWGNDGQPPECTELFNFPCLIRATGEFVVLSLKSTGIAAGKQLNSMIRMRRKDAFAGVYLVESFPDNKKGQDFFNHRILNAGWVSTDEYKGAEGMYETMLPQVKAGKATIHTDGMAAETESDRAFADRDTEL